MPWLKGRPKLRVTGSRTSNAWSSGSRILTCLGCDRAFRSVGKHNRLCDLCGDYAARGLPVVPGTQHRGPLIDEGEVA